MLRSKMSLTPSTPSCTPKSVYLRGNEKSYAADHCSSLVHMSYAGKNAASPSPWLIFQGETSALLSARQNLSKKR